MDPVLRDYRSHYNRPISLATDQFYMRVLKPIPLAQRLHAPRLRMADDEPDRHSTWTELFYDLVFVVAVAAVGHRFAEDVSWRGVAEVSLLFLAVWDSWM